MLRRLLGGGHTASAPTLAILAAAALSAVDLPAQDPQPVEPQRTESQPSGAREGRRGRGPRQNAPVIALRAGFVHPVSGPTLENGVVLIRGNRIVAVGPAAEVEVPDGATVVDYADGHIYPGFVDALSRAFADDVAADGNVDAGTPILGSLDRYDETSLALAPHGVTTAYVSNRSDTVWRGQGALIRPRADGFAAFPEHETVGLHMRLTTGPGVGHPLQRLKQLAGFGGEFEQLDAYEKSREEFAKKLEEYEKKFTEFLEWHRKRAAEKAEEKATADKDGEKPAEKDGEKPAAGETGRPPEAGGGRPPRGRGQRPPGRGTPPDRTSGPAEGQEKAQPQGRPGGAPAADAAAKADEGDKAPERPKYPSEPKANAAKDALIAVRDGEMTLFVEARRVDEVERALDLVREHELRRVVFEYATGAAEAAAKIAAAGIPVVLDTAMPPALGSLDAATRAYVPEQVEWESVAARLAAAGTPFALGSGSNRRAQQLPSLVAEAIGQGIDAETALRAITLTPAEILGVADRVGSIEPRKLADLVVTSAPLEASGARILRVMSAGTTVYEAR